MLKESNLSQQLMPFLVRLSQNHSYFLHKVLAYGKISHQTSCKGVRPELEDGRLLLIEYLERHVLEVRTSHIMKSLENWARLVGEHENQGVLDVGITVNGDDYVIEGHEGTSEDLSRMDTVI